MDIAFIKPPQTYLFDPERNPPLGLMYVAAAAEEAGYCVEYVNFSKIEGIDFLQTVPEADIYAFTVSILDYEFSHKLAGELKDRNRCVIVFGGVLPTTAPELIDYRVVDTVIMGEGEKAFLDFLNDFSQRGKISEKYMSSPINDLDTVHFPLREGMAFISNTILGEEISSTTIITSRGCPFDCTFCASKTVWGQKVRFRSVENVLAEIDNLIKDYDIKGLRFLDDTMTLRMDRFKKLCSGLNERKIFWRCSTRSNLVTEELAKLMHDSGCMEVGVGVETADPKVLKFLGKGVKIEEHEMAIKILKNVGMNVACFFMAGLPGESEETPELNISFVKRTRPDRIFCATFMPYPGTEIWRDPEKYEVKIITKNLSKYNQVSGVGEEDREFAVIPFGLSYKQLSQNRKKMIDFLMSENKLRG